MRIWYGFYWQVKIQWFRGELWLFPSHLEPFDRLSPERSTDEDKNSIGQQKNRLFSKSCQNKRVYHWPASKQQNKRSYYWPASKQADKSWFAGCCLDHPSSKWTLQIVFDVESTLLTIIKVTKITSKTQVKVLTVVEWRNWGGKPIILPSQSITKDSSSVQAGDDAHLRIGQFLDILKLQWN